MERPGTSSPLYRRLVESLYCDTMVLADEALHYCEHQAIIDSAALDPVTSVVFSCESLRLTTRLMHLLAWLLHRRATFAGEPVEGEERLTATMETAPHVRQRLPEEARALIAVGEALYRRAQALDAAMAGDRAIVSPARAMIQRLAIDLRG